MSFYDDLQVGLELSTTSYRVTRGTVLNYLESVGDESELYRDVALGGEAIAPPTVCDVVLFDMPEVQALIAALGGMYHTSMAYDFLAPVTVGKRVTVKARVTDKFMKRERRCFVIEAAVDDEDGRELLRARYSFAAIQKGA